MIAGRGMLTTSNRRPTDSASQQVSSKPDTNHNFPGCVCHIWLLQSLYDLYFFRVDLEQQHLAVFPGSLLIDAGLNHSFHEGLQAGLSLFHSIFR